MNALREKIDAVKRHRQQREIELKKSIAVLQENNKVVVDKLAIEKSKKKEKYEELEKSRKELNALLESLGD